MRLARLTLFAGLALSLAGCGTVSTLQAALPYVGAIENGVTVTNSAIRTGSAELYGHCVELERGAAALVNSTKAGRFRTIVANAGAALASFCAAPEPPTDIRTAVLAVRSGVAAVRAARAAPS